MCDAERYGVPACKEFTLYLNGLRQTAEIQGSVRTGSVEKHYKDQRQQKPHSLTRERKSMGGFLEEVLSEELIGHHRRCVSAVLKLG